MKTEFLQNFKVGDQALQKEIIDAILAENGRDIEAAKKPFADYESVKEQLKTAKISIHASRLGSDPAVPPRKPNIFQFQSTLPVWGATAKLHNSSPAILRKSDNSLLFLPDFHRPDNFMEHTSAP